MFISEAAALSIVREMKEITGHDINIMDGTGRYTRWTGSTHSAP